MTKPKAEDPIKHGQDFPEEHQEAWSNGYLWGQRSIVNTLLKDEEDKVAEMEKDYEIARRALSYILHGATGAVSMYAAANEAMAKMRPSGGFEKKDRTT